MLLLHLARQSIGSKPTKQTWLAYKLNFKIGRIRYIVATFALLPRSIFYRLDGLRIGGVKILATLNLMKFIPTYCGGHIAVLPPTTLLPYFVPHL